MLKRLFRRQEPDPKTGGLIGCHGLGAWWESAFTADERARVKRVYKPVGAPASILDQGRVSCAAESATRFLLGMAGWFTKADDRDLGDRMLLKADEFMNDPVLDRHALYQQMNKSFARNRSDAARLAVARDACRKQIALAAKVAKAMRKVAPDQPLPEHPCYGFTARELEQAGAYDKAILLLKDARAQGWAGDHDAAMERLDKKAAKSVGKPS